MAAARIKLLTSKRETIKNQIKSFGEFLDKYEPENQNHELKLRLDKLDVSFKNLDDICDELNVLSNNQVDERFEIQDNYFKLSSQGQQLMTESNIQLLRGNSISNNISESRTDSNKRRIKLPPTSLPVFSGKHEDWLSFKNKFTSLIHSQNDISNVDKLQYLQSAVKGEALRKIQIFNITDQNYSRAWEILTKAYENKRLLVSSHLSKLLNLPKITKETCDNLMSLVDNALQHLESLKILGVQIPNEMIVQLLEERLDPVTFELWDKTIRGEDFPTLDEMTEFIYGTAARLSRRKRDKPAIENSASHNKHRKFEFNKDQRKVLLSSTRKCPCCKQSFHPLFKCKKFLDMTVAQREKYVSTASVCSNCLRNHGNEACAYGNCKQCNSKHNTLLHVSENEQA